MKHQRGYIWRVGGSWYGRWYQDEIVDSVVVRRQHAEKLCEYGDRYRSKTDVQPILEAKLRPINERRSNPEGTLTVDQYFEKFFLPYAKAELKPSTASGYSGLWQTYVKAHVLNVTLRDFRCVDATKVLAAIHLEHELNKKSLRNCKALLSSVFTHAKRAGVVEGLNPVKDAGIPRAAKKGTPTHAYSPQEVVTLLASLNGVSRIAVALMYFCGLRPGEARAARWDDYDAKKGTLRVRASMWRTYMTLPKTEESSGLVPVCAALADILAAVKRSSEFILAGPSGKPVDLHNLARRIVVPSLDLCGICHDQKSKHAKATHAFERDKSIPKWMGWYALRRGLATVATSVDSALAAKSLLRHANIQTTAAHYIKDVADEAVRAVDKVSALFDNRHGSGAPQ